MEMDEATRARYEVWKRKKIRKQMIRLLIMLTILVILILGLRQLFRSNEVDEATHLIEETRLGTDFSSGSLGVGTRPKRSLSRRLSVMQDELEVILDEMVSEMQGIVGLSYYCLTTDRHIQINGNELFFSASTIKLPTHMMIAESVQDGTLSWDQILTVEQSDWLDGSGVLQHRIDIGYEMTLYEVMSYSITYSDNIAHRMLTRTLIPGFQHDEYGLDNNDWQLTTTIFNRYLSGRRPTGRMELSPNQLTEIYRVLYRGQDQIEGYGIILQYMMNSLWTDRFATPLLEGIVAHTPGWRYPESHDSGIFFTETPYILVVMTSGLYFYAPDFLTEVSELVFTFHNDHR